MSKFFNVLFLILTWLLLVIGGFALVAGLSIYFQDLHGWEVALPTAISSFILSGLVWTLRSVLVYTTYRIGEYRDAEETEDEE